MPADKTLIQIQRETGFRMRAHVPGTRITALRTRKNQRRFIFHLTSSEPYSDPAARRYITRESAPRCEVRAATLSRTAAQPVSCSHPCGAGR